MNSRFAELKSGFQMLLSLSTRLGPMLLLATAALGAVLVIVALAAPGDPDPGFGSDGKVTTDFNTDVDSGRAIVVQSDGKIVVAGYAHDGGSGFGHGTDFALARYNSDGSLDTSFGAGGLVTTGIGTHTVGYGNDEGHGMVIQPDGKIIVAGFANFGNSGNSDYRIVMARYTTTGALDSGFGTDGIVVTTKIFSSTDNLGRAVALQTDGKIVVAGNALFTTTVGGIHDDFAVVRYDTDGSRDNSFGAGGAVVTNFGGSSSAHAVAIQPDGKIVAAGSAWDGVVNDYVFALARYSGIDGNLDPTFGAGGLITTTFGLYDSINDIAIQPDGKIVAVGETKTAELGEYDFAVARYNTDGSLDTGFGAGGIVTTTFGVDIRDEARGVVILQNGKIVVAGSSGAATAVDNFALACYNSDGSLDTTFGTGGITTTTIVAGENRGYAIATQSDGQLVVAGECLKAGSGTLDFAVARYTPPYGYSVYLPLALYNYQP
ncbi:MAG: hypothetical protein U9R15_15605 [Chloroflexota bacterium]|nr:hypothetical protein [Chloroflexota bacterium]